MKALWKILIGFNLLMLTSFASIYGPGWVTIEPQPPQSGYPQYGSGGSSSISSFGTLYSPCPSVVRPGQVEIAEASFSNEIKTLARNLENDPTRIYNYVRKYIRYAHYFGAKKASSTFSVGWDS
jgi:hypothetical protein